MWEEVRQMNDYVPRLRDWFELKKRLSTKESPLFFKEGEIWWCSIGFNLGDEIYGKGELFNRPVLIFKKFTSNSFLGLPLTSKDKRGSWYVSVQHTTGKSCVVLNQARVLDKRRLTKRMCAIDDFEYERVRSNFLSLYGS